MAANSFNDTVVTAVRNAGIDPETGGPNIYATEAAQWTGLPIDQIFALQNQYRTDGGFDVAGLSSALQSVASPNTMQNVAQYVDVAGQGKIRSQGEHDYDPNGGLATAAMGTAGIFGLGSLANSGLLGSYMSGNGLGGSAGGLAGSGGGLQTTSQLLENPIPQEVGGWNSSLQTPAPAGAMDYAGGVADGTISTASGTPYSSGMLAEMASKLGISSSDLLKLGGGAISTLAGIYTASNKPTLNAGDPSSATNAATTDWMRNNPNYTNPYGSRTITTGADGRPLVTDTLNAEQQSLLTGQNKLSQGLLDTTNNLMPRVQDTLSKGPDLSSVQGIADKAYGAFTSRLDPQWTQETASQETKLKNQGLTPGSEAYDNAMRVFNQGKNDAYQQANLGAINTMPQTYQLGMAAYNEPLNTLNAVRSGAQVQSPTFQSYSGGSNQTGATQVQNQQNLNQYNAQTGANNALTSGLFGLGQGLFSSAFDPYANSTQTKNAFNSGLARPQ